ncbi:MAG: hypothetical protein J6T70_04130 [Bacteroidales bacterium]|nr:hypothetical protein [Bacteroidales bacterium]
MSEPKIIAEYIEELRQKGEIIIIPSTKINQSETAQTLDFETERRKHIIMKLCRKLSERRLPIAVVSDWVDKQINYCQKRIKQRSTFTSVVWAIDALKFLCEEWQMPLPECYHQEVEKIKRLNEKKMRKTNAA